MNNELIKSYENISIHGDFNIFKDVEIDNVCEKLNEFSEGHFSYDVDLINILDKVLMKVTVYLPGKVFVGIEHTDAELANDRIKYAILSGCKKAFSSSTDTIQPQHDKDIAVTTLEDIAKIEEEISIMQEKQSIEVIESEPIEFTQDPPNTTDNKFGIRQDQIDFMKKFQDTFNIDTTEKFDIYVDTWNSTNSAYNVKTKKELIASGPQAIDLFITWVKEVNKDNVANNNFVCPTDNEWDNCCK